MKGNHNLKMSSLIVLSIVFNISKIQNERKSQHKASRYLINQIVFNISKIQNERKSQRAPANANTAVYCVQHIKDTK